MSHRTLFHAAACALAMAAASPALADQGFECPAQPLDEARAAAIKAQLPSGDAFDDGGALVRAVTTLNAEGVSKGMVIDNLIAAYCPVVAADGGLSDAQKTEKVNRFAARIVSVVYNIDSADAIIVSVPFPPVMMDSINAKAQEKGLSAAEWIRTVVEIGLTRE